MIAALLPGDVASAESSAVPPEYALFPAELALIARAVPERRAEFTTARHCARRALAELGMPPTPILRGPYREPIWPQGVVGSITHCPGYQAAAVAPTARFHSIGIDAELNEPLAIGVLHKISLPGERAQLRASDGAHLDRVLFSAKEAVYKTWFPLARRWLGLKDARVTLHSDGTLEVEVLVPGPLASPPRPLARPRRADPHRGRGGRDRRAKARAGFAPYQSAGLAPRHIAVRGACFPRRA